MQAIAFEATTENGTIKIPQQYLKAIPDHVEVIVVLKEEKKIPTTKVKFQAIGVDTKVLKFDRDEANER